MISTNFMIASPGHTASEAFNLARDYAKKDCDHGVYLGTIAEKYSYFLLAGEPIACYDDAVKKAHSYLEKGNLDPTERCGYALCMKYKNVSDGIDYIFFGWMHEE